MFLLYLRLIFFVIASSVISYINMFCYKFLSDSGILQMHCDLHVLGKSIYKTWGYLSVNSIIFGSILNSVAS